MAIVYTDLCSCDCHFDKNVSHIAPCCIACNLCGVNVVNMTSHIARCHAAALAAVQGNATAFEDDPLENVPADGQQYGP